MKRITFVLIFIGLGIFNLQAQKNVQGYFGISESNGVAVMGTTYKSSQYYGVESGKNYFSNYGYSKSKLPISVGMQVEAGVVVKEKLMIGTGIKYLFRQDEGIINCDVCDLCCFRAADWIDTPGWR